jgi:hypothetical protein
MDRLLPEARTITDKDLLSVPPGGISLEGVKFNVQVGVRFIESWFRGRGSFVYRAAAEDSATAEISRSQVRAAANPVKSTVGSATTAYRGLTGSGLAEASAFAFRFGSGYITVGGQRRGR